MENISKNLIDSDECKLTYLRSAGRSARAFVRLGVRSLTLRSTDPATTLIHTRTVSMLASLWHADETGAGATGTATTGSSEAIQLAGLAMKKKWQERMRAAGKDEYRPGSVLEF